MTAVGGGFDYHARGQRACTPHGRRTACVLRRVAWARCKVRVRVCVLLRPTASLAQQVGASFLGDRAAEILTRPQRAMPMLAVRGARVVAR